MSSASADSRALPSSVWYAWGAPLRRRGRPRGVEEQERVGTRQRDRRRLALAGAGDQIGERERTRRRRTDRNHVLERRQLRPQPEHDLCRRVVLRLRQHHRSHRAAVPEQRLELGRAIRHVQGLHDRAASGNREIRDHELDDVRELHRDHVALADPQPVERALERTREPAQLGPGHAPVALPERVVAGTLARVRVEPVAQGVVPPVARGAVARLALGVRPDLDGHAQLRAGSARARPSCASSSRSNHGASASSAGSAGVVLATRAHCSTLKTM